MFPLTFGGGQPIHMQDIKISHREYQIGSNCYDNKNPMLCIYVLNFVLTVLLQSIQVLNYSSSAKQIFIFFYL